MSAFGGKADIAFDLLLTQFGLRPRCGFDSRARRWLWYTLVERVVL